MKQASVKYHYPFQILIVDALIILLVLLLTILLGKEMFIGVVANESKTLSVATPLIIFAIIIFAMFIYVERKYNHLKLNNVFLYFAIAISILNLIIILALPAKISLPNNQIYTISTVERIYSIIFGFADALLFLSLFYLLPRKLMHTKWIILIAYVIAGVAYFFIIASLFTDWENYINIFKHGISSDYAIRSLAGHYIVFGRILLSGTFAVITLHIYTKKRITLLLLIPIAIQVLFVYSKTGIVLVYLTILTYLTVLVVRLAKKNRDNKIIITLIILFIICVLSLFIMFIHFSNYGILLKIKMFFYKTLEGAQKTIRSRMLIWDNTVRMLNTSPLYWIMGFGGSMYGILLNITYTHDPAFSDSLNMSYAHNATMEILGRGGLVFLLINVLVLIYLIYLIHKNYHINKIMSIMHYFFLGMSLLDGIVESNYLLVEGDNVIFITIAVLPIIAINNIYNDCDEIKIRKDIVDDAKKIKNVKFKNWILKMNAKKIIYEAKRINQDYEKRQEL